MSDIVQELRSVTSGGEINAPDGIGRTIQRVCSDAATEIESLRAQLASIRQVAGAVSPESGLTFGEIKGGKYARPAQQPDGSYKMETF